MPFYFQKRSELRRYKVGFLSVPTAATAGAVYASIGGRLNGAESVGIAVGSWLLYLFVITLITIPANKFLIQIFGRKQLLAEQRNVARVLITDFFDGKSEIGFPDPGDDLVKAEAVAMLKEFFEE